jgi:hypothetical protein
MSLHPLQRGADIQFLSAFPAEKELLYPPLTFLKPSPGRKPVRVDVAGATFSVVEAEPFIN